MKFEMDLRMLKEKNGIKVSIYENEGNLSET